MVATIKLERKISLIYIVHINEVIPEIARAVLEARFRLRHFATPFNPVQISRC